MSRKKGLSVREMAIFAMLGAIAFCSKILMEFAPNIHFLGMFTMLFAITYRGKGLIPLAVALGLIGLFGGGIWWIPYLYLFPILFGITLLLPKNMPKKLAIPVYMAVCGLFGLLFGILYAPFEAVVRGFSWQAMLTWISFGLPYDILHAIGNTAAAALLVPLSELLLKLEKQK